MLSLTIQSFVFYFLVIATFVSLSVSAIAFEEVSSLHIWITVSSLANKDPNNNKALIFRQIELNWINAPLDDTNDYIGLYLDSQPDANVLPVSVHKLNGRTSGQIITDYYLPQIDFFNETNNNFVRYFGSKASQAESSLTDPVRFRDIGVGGHETEEARWKRYNDVRGYYPSVSAAPSAPPISTARQAPPQATIQAGVLIDECIGYCIAYHSRHRILAKNCLKTSPNWMQDSYQIIGARSLPSLMIPGTHNSGTYPKQLDKTVLQMINKYQLNQDESIFNQLVYGIRHLDLRVGFSKVKQRSERLWIYHDIFRTEVTLNEVFEQVKKFLDLTSHEIVIMDFHRFTVGFQDENISVQRDRHAKVIDLLFKQLGRYIVPSYLGQHAPLNEYIAMGKRLIIGYADRASLIGSNGDQHSIYALYTEKGKQQVRDIDAIKQDQDDMINQDRNETDSNATSELPQVDRRVGSRIYNKLKSLKLISNSFSKRSIESHPGDGARRSMKISFYSNNEEDSNGSGNNNHEETTTISKVALFFPPVRHLWPNKDTLDGLAQYMNESTCRKYFGELRSMMVELTPTVFGAISDKYDGNRRLAQLANRPVTDWIRDRWLHCINIVASDFFLGNDIIRLSIYANRMRLLHRNVDLNSYGQCKSFRRIEHLLDKSKIPIQFAYQPFQKANDGNLGDLSSYSPQGLDDDVITHTSPNGNKILLRPLTASFHSQSIPREQRESFVDNVSDGFADLFSSFKRLLNL